MTSFVLLIWRELTIDEPVINFRVLRSRQLAAGVSIAAFLGLALFGSIFVLPVFLQQLHGFTANQTGLVILPGALASAVTMALRGAQRQLARRARHGDHRCAAASCCRMWHAVALTLDERARRSLLAAHHRAAWGWG